MTNSSLLNPDVISPEKVWQRMRDAALLEGIKPSTTFSTSPIEPSALLGSYSCVWDSHTDMECMDDIGEEISWLHLTADSSLTRGTPVKDETKSGAKTKEAMGTIKPSNSVTFADIQGEFKWWDMVGSFKGLYRPMSGLYGVKENIWLIGDISWRCCKGDEGRVLGESAKVTRNTNDFGLATLITLDKRGQPFLEMLYNATKYYTRERERRLQLARKESDGATSGTSCAADSAALEYVRVLYKKQKVAGRESSLMITGNEGQRLMRDTAVDLSGCRNSEPLDKNKKPVDSEHEVDSMSSGDDEDDNEDDENGVPEGEQNTLVGVKRELDGEDAKLAKKRKI